MNKSAAETHRILEEVYREHSLAEKTCLKWFARFKSSGFDLEDKKRLGQPKKFDDQELEELLNENSCQTLEELSTPLGVDLSNVGSFVNDPSGRKLGRIRIWIKTEGNWKMFFDLWTSASIGFLHRLLLVLNQNHYQHYLQIAIYYKLLKPKENHHLE